MAIILFTQPTPFPIAPLRQVLANNLPLYKWRIGEDDDGGDKTMGRWSDHQLIAGRSAASAVFCEVITRAEHYAAEVPIHTWYMEVKRPACDSETIAHRLLMLVCGVVMIADDDALCQLLPGGGWLSSEDMVRATKALIGGEPLEKLAQLGRPAGAIALRAASPSASAGRYAGLPPERAMMLSDMDETMARILHEKGMGEIADGMGLTKPPAFAHEQPRDNALPTLAMLATEPLLFDWPLVREGLNACDGGGDWTVEQEGPTHGVLRGRGATVTIQTESAPLPAYLLAQAFARSHGLSEEDKRSINTHRVHQTVSIDLDTREADFVDVRQTAKAITLFVGLAAKRHGFVGLFNAGVGTVMPTARVKAQVGILGGDEVPITFWTWAAFDSIQPDAISISTGGMRPFVGYEVEVWNAPGTLEAVAERLNGVLRYLLINGPVIKHGETIGDHAEDRSTRCFHSVSRAQRGDAEVPALLLEFDTMEGAATPRPDLPSAGAPAQDGMTDILAKLRMGAVAEGSQAPAPSSPAAPPRPPLGAPRSFGRKQPGAFGRKTL